MSYDGNRNLVGAPARLIVAGEWRDCRLKQITPVEALFEIEVALGVGDAVVACVTELGALPGTVKAAEGDEISISFTRPMAAAHDACQSAGYRRQH